MKTKLIKATIALSMVMAVSAPTAAFADTNCNLADTNCNTQTKAAVAASKNWNSNLLKSCSLKFDGGKLQFVPQNVLKDNCQISDILGNLKDWQGNTENNGSSNSGNVGNTENNNNTETTDKEENTQDKTETENSTAQGYEMQVVQLVNEERAKQGLEPLTYNAKLSNVADIKAADMRDNNYFSHTSPTYGSPFDMMKSFGISYTSAGENIAKGQKTPESVMNAWMNSSGHRANILSSNYEQIGIGYETDQKGNTYWVQMFIR